MVLLLVCIFFLLTFSLYYLHNKHQLLFSHYYGRDVDLKSFSFCREDTANLAITYFFL